MDKLFEHLWGNKYDKNNKVFNKYYLEDYPHLVDKDYQAVRITIPGPLTPGNGPNWICVDRVTGEVLLIIFGR